MQLDPQILMSTAADAAREGASALAPFMSRERDLGAREKSLHDFVTEADLASERAIRERILDRHPDHGVLGEEGEKASYRESRPTWIIDPLDGTTNFIHGFGVFAVSVACAAEGRILAGAVLDPSRDEIFIAGRGRGATLNGHPISVSARSSLRGSLIATGFPFRRLPRLGPYLASFEAVFPEVAGIRRAGSAAIDLACVACGRFDGFWEEGLGAWDMAAGALLIEEAGGRVTDFLGGDDYLQTGAIVAGGPALQAELRARIAPHLGSGC